MEIKTTVEPRELPIQGKRQIVPFADIKKKFFLEALLLHVTLLIFFQRWYINYKSYLFTCRVIFLLIY